MASWGRLGRFGSCVAHIHSSASVIACSVSGAAGHWGTEEGRQTISAYCLPSFVTADLEGY